MDRYQIAETENGPWLEMVVTNNPSHALQHARGAFPEWEFIWVAKMRPIKGEDLLPSPEVMFGDMMEQVAQTLGNQVVDQLTDDLLPAYIGKRLVSELTGCLLDAETDVMVPDIKKRYGRDQFVTMADFVRGKPRLEDLLL